MTSSRFALVALIVPTLALAQGVDLNTITKVEVNGSTIVITGNKKPNFTTFTMTDPPRLVIDISEAVFSGVPDEMQVGNGVVTAIKTASYGSDASAIARVLIGFEKDFENPDYQTSESKLVITVPAGEAPAVAQAPAAQPPPQQAAQPDAEAQRREQEAKAQQEQQARAAAEEAARQQAEQQAQAQAEADRKKQEQQAAALAEAERKQQAQDEAAAAKAQAEEERRAKAQAAADEKARKAEEAKAEAQRQREEREAARQAAAEEKARKAEEARAEAQRLKEERELARRAAAEEKARKAEEARAAREQQVAKADTGAAPEGAERGGADSAESGLSVSSRRKTLSLVGFRQQATTSRVFVRTDEPVRYTVQRGGDKSVVLELENTRLGLSNNDRPLDTSYFDTAVAMVDPEQGPTRTVRIEIQLKEDVPYETRQEGNEVYLEFQRPVRR